MQEIDVNGTICLSILEFAKRVKRDSSVIRNRVEKGTLPSMSIAGKKVVPLDDGLEAFGIFNATKRSNALPKNGITKTRTQAESRQAKLEAEAQLKTLDYQERAKELVSVEQVKSELGKVAGAIRQGLENFTGRVHIELAALTDPDDVYRYLNKEINELMENFSNDSGWIGTGSQDISRGPKAKRNIKRK